MNMQSKPITILAIESSCDETSAAIIHNGKILSNITATQEVHRNYGGVVPELASRAHEKSIIPVVSEAFIKANIQKKTLNAVAFTQGPGLLGSLLVGSCFAKSIAFALNIPLIAVNHMEAHIFAHFIDEPVPEFPFLCLTVSGGHTQIVLVKSFNDLEILGETLDDAVGEAFDKSAKLLSLPYPGGPLIDQYAKSGNPKTFVFPIPDIAALDFSFSGIKTSILYFLRNNIEKDSEFISKNIADICASIQYTLIEILIRKLKKAIDQYHIQRVAIAGGVAANSELRQRITNLGKSKNLNIFIPKLEYCTDNAAMIAITAHHKFQNKQFTNQSATPDARLNI
jgi:N6-L-threonylcarbamoyladenine synthase